VALRLVGVASSVSRARAYAAESVNAAPRDRLAARIGASVGDHGRVVEDERRAARAVLAAPRAERLAAGDRADHERGGGVGPPPAEQGIRAEADEQCQREVGAEHVLGALAGGRLRAERAADPALRDRQQRHRRRRRGGERDADPAPSGMRPVDQAPGRLERDVGGEQRIGDGDQLLRSALGRLGVDAAGGQEPEDHAARGELDQAVDPERDECDRAGREPGAERDRELHEVPPRAAPREQSRAAHQTVALAARHRQERDGAHAETPSNAGTSASSSCRPVSVSR
jgi:hypothetical protein